MLVIVGFGNGGRRWKFRTGGIGGEYGGRFQQASFHPEEERTNGAVRKKSKVIFKFYSFTKKVEY